MKIQIELTQADYKAFLRFVVLRLKAAHRRRSYYSAILVGLPVGVIAGLILAKIHSTHHGLGSFFAGLITGVFVLYFLALASTKAGRTLLRPYDDGYLIGPQEIETNDQGLQIHSRHHQALFRWSIISAPETTRDHIFIMVDPTAGVIIPRRSFGAATEQEAFLGEIRKFAQRVN